MSDFVLDASVCLSWYLKASPEQKEYAGRVLDLMINGAVPAVPALFIHEVGARLIKARRAKDITAATLDRAMRELDALLYDVHHVGSSIREVVAKATAYNLSGYDAVYFDLARRLAVPIASMDSGILTACESFKVKQL